MQEHKEEDIGAIVRELQELIDCVLTKKDVHKIVQMIREYDSTRT